MTGNLREDPWRSILRVSQFLYSQSRTSMLSSHLACIAILFQAEYLAHRKFLRIPNQEFPFGINALVLKEENRWISEFRGSASIPEQKISPGYSDSTIIKKQHSVQKGEELTHLSSSFSKSLTYAIGDRGELMEMMEGSNRIKKKTTFLIYRRACYTRRRQRWVCDILNIDKPEYHQPY